MDPNEFQQRQKLSQSLLQPSLFSKSKQHSSFSKGKNKCQMIYDSFTQQDNTQDMRQDIQQANQLSVVQRKNSQVIKQKQLFKLQEILQKQFLMLQKQQSQKIKFIKQIQGQMKSYYSLLIQLKERRDEQRRLTSNGEKQGQTRRKAGNRIVTDDGFDNCYNFIKEVVINTSRNFNVAITLLMTCTISYNKQQKGSIFIEDYKLLIDLFVNVFYERVSQTDPFLKQITKMISVLLGKLPLLQVQQKQTLMQQDQRRGLNGKLNEIKTNHDKILCIFQEYMQKQQIQDYFDILSNSVLKNIQNISFSRVQNRNRAGISMHHSKGILPDQQNSIQVEKQFTDPISSFGFNNQQNWLEYFKPFESFNEQKRALAMTFISKIYSQADLCPMNLKIPLKYFFESSCQYLQQKYPIMPKYDIKQLASLKVWQLIQKFYMRGLEQKDNNQSVLFRQMQAGDKQILGDVVRMIRHSFNGQAIQTILEEDQLLISYRRSKRFITKVVQKLLNFNQQKYSHFKSQIESVLGKVQTLRLKRNKSQHQKGASQQDEVTSSRSIAFEPVRLNSNTSEFSSQQNMVLEMDSSHSHSELQIQLPPQLIKIYGGCISFKQLHVLLTTMRRIKDKIPNQRIINRVQRIFDMSPELEFFLNPKGIQYPNQIQNLFIILLQLEYDPLISDDYHKLYFKQYEDDKVKNIIRQIICQLKLNQLNKKVNKRDVVYKRKVNILDYQLQDFKKMKKQKISPQKAKQIKNKQKQQDNVLMTLLEKIALECSRSVEGTQVQFSLHKGLSIQLLKKIKYLLYLFQNKSSELNQGKILKEMLDQVKYRNQKMTILYQHTKFGLLAVIGNIRHYRKLLISKKQIENKVNSRIKNIKLLQKLQLDLCLTSPYTRTNPDFTQRSHSPSKQANQSFSSTESPRNTFSKKKQENITKTSFTKIKTPLNYPNQQIVLTKNQNSEAFFQPFNRYKYRISNADQIVLCITTECIHKDNIFMGLNYHINSIQQFICMFAKLREVTENLFFAQFIISQELSLRIYKDTSHHLKHFPPMNHFMASVFVDQRYQKLNFSIDRINKVIHTFFEYLFQEKLNKQKNIDKKNQVLQLKKVIKDIILRGIHQKLVKRLQKNIKVKAIGNSHKSYRKDKINSRCLDTHGIQASKFQQHLLSDLQNMSEIQQQQLQIHSMKKTQSQSSQLTVQQSQAYRVSTSQKNNSRSQQKVDTGSGLKPSDFQKKSCQKPSVTRGVSRQAQQETVIQSRNDQIFLFQIHKISNSKYFTFQPAYNFRLPSTNDTISQPDNTQSLPRSDPRHNPPNQNKFHLKQLEQVCSRYIKSINKKQTPEDKIQLLRNIGDIYKLVVREFKYSVDRNKMTGNQKVDGSDMKSSDTYQVEEQLHHQDYYTLEKLIFRSIIIAEPPNFITNLAFIEVFLHKDKLLSGQGKILNLFKKVTYEIFEMNGIGKYMCFKSQSGGKNTFQNQLQDEGQLKYIIQNIKNSALRQNQVL